jgi:diacylglycerol O-acyltransferase
LSDTPATPARELDEPTTSYAPVAEGSLLHGGALVFFDGPLERLDVVRAVARAALVHPELRNRPVSMPLAADLLAWTPDATYRASRQVRIVDLDDASDPAALQRAVTMVWSEPLPALRPPWQVTIFSDGHGGRSAVLVKAHVTLVRAFGIAGLADIVLGTPLDAEPPPAPVARARPGVMPALVEAAAALAEESARRSRALAGEVRAMLRPGVALARTREVGRILESAGTLLSSPAPETPWNAELGRDRRVAWLALSRDVVGGIADVLGGDWEDAWLTIVADALGRYLRGRGRSTIGLTLLAYVPGADHGYGANVLSSAAGHATARLIALPVEEMSPGARHADIRRSRHHPLAAARGSGVEQIARMSHRLPGPLQSLLGSLCYQAANTIVLDEQASECSLTLGVRSAVRLVPLAMLPWHVGLAIAACASRDAEIMVGITADATLVPDVGDVQRALHDAYVDTAAAAGVPPIAPLAR